MNINGAFPSDYLRASDLNGRAFTMNMARVELAKIGDDEKPILYFQGADKGLALNKTNAGTISDLYGDETDNWFGRPIEVFPDQTDFQGKRVACIRVRAPQGQPTQQQNAMASQAPLNQQNGMGAAGNYQAQGQQGNQGMGQSQQTPFDNDLNDSIPY